MKKLILCLSLLISSFAGAQVSNYNLPDCLRPFSFTVTNGVITQVSDRTILQPAGRSISFDNRNLVSDQGLCTTWHLAYSVTTGISAVSIEPDFANDNTNQPGAWTIWTASQVNGTLPMTVTSGIGKVVSFFGNPDWVSVFLNSATGSGTVSGFMWGWRAVGTADTVNGATPIQGTTGGTPVNAITNTGGFKNTFNLYMAALPNAATTATTTTGAYRFYCNNITAGAITITITDNQGSPVSFVTAFSLAANSNIRFPPGEGLMRMQGVKWSASGAASVNCTIDGFQ
jgi:hypothetical protein